MMSGVELNALMNQISSQGRGQGGEEPAESAVKTEKSASRSYSNYNREIWRVQGGILESSLVEFCVQRTRCKFIDDITAKRKPNLTLFKEDWLDLIEILKRIVADIINKGDSRSEWLKTVTITHQLCAQKYRNLKKVYHISKQKDSRKFSYKNQFKEIEDLSSTVLQESTKVVTGPSQIISEAGLSIVPGLIPNIAVAENVMHVNPASPSPTNANVKTEREPEIGVEEILVNEDCDERAMESPDSSYTSPTHLHDESPETKSEPPSESGQGITESVLPLVLGGNDAVKLRTEELLAQISKYIGDQNAENKKVKLVSTKTDVTLSPPVKKALSGIPHLSDTQPTVRSSTPTGSSVQPTAVEKILLKIGCMMDSWHREMREHNSRMERLLTERNKISEESNRLQREKIALEREKFEFMKLKRTVEEMNNIVDDAPAEPTDEKHIVETDPDDIPIIQTVE